MCSVYLRRDVFDYSYVDSCFTLLESMRCRLRCCLAVAAGEGAGIGAPEDLREVARVEW